MILIVEATYENGVLKPAQPLPFKEHERVRVTVEAPAGQQVAALVRCDDPALIEWAATDPDLAYPESRETP